MLTAATNLAFRGHGVTVAGRRGSIFLQRATEGGLSTVAFNIHADFAPLKIFKIARFFRQAETDICILNLNKDVRVAGVAARKAGVPLILARHGLELISDKWKHKMAMKLVDGIITNSQTIRGKYNELGWMPAEKTEVIYNGLTIPENVESIDLHEKYSIPRNHIIFGSAGRLAHQKGFDLLIEAAAQLKNKPFTFLIAGEGKLQKKLLNLISRYGVQEKVKLVGFLENALPFLNSVDIVVLPSRYEGMPNTVLEGMALGKPVLAAEVNGVKELIRNGQNGFSIPPESVTELAAGILRAANCRGLAALEQNAVDTIKTNHSVEKMIDHMEEFFIRKYHGKG